MAYKLKGPPSKKRRIILMQHAVSHSTCCQCSSCQRLEADDSVLILVSKRHTQRPPFCILNLDTGLEEQAELAAYQAKSLRDQINIDAHHTVPMERFKGWSLLSHYHYSLVVRSLRDLHRVQQLIP